MSLRKIGFFILSFVLVFSSCNEDDGGAFVPVPPRDRTEQQIADKDSIMSYLKTHYYNSSAYDGSNPNPTIQDLIISEIEEGGDVPIGNTLLLNAIETKNTISFDTNYEYYILRLNHGGGVDFPTFVDSPMFTDNIRMTYEGSFLNGIIFDGNNFLSPVSFDLLNLIEGWRNVFPEFNTAEDFFENEDGTVEFLNPGVGVMFLPSGLGYFNSTGPSGRLPAYSPLIFKFELLQYFESDIDNDGIPSYLEGLDENGEPFTTIEELALINSDEDNLINISDPDDDNDGIATINEITITNYERDTRNEVLAIPLASNEVLLNKIKTIRDSSGMISKYIGVVITFTDSDNDGTPDYLDAE
ncbi:MAG: hypothetical protein P8K68_13805 [Algibacter sp.]|uniref:FKBP-type peptidyl-prolyl cis-trans isomerase n=1 Tax=Algibacter sp. TaxID=1872428 RepID=UPI00260872D3|nr:hypothetical protein [Algibacter sp.]MDG1731269.1 hypothetical protein [Algibacter sp.]MDG2179842.1 hypothetical protein [Algibacter sp.]